MKNVIIFLVDAFRQKNLSLYGYSKETDKNIKQIAEECVVFDNFYSTSNSTAPSLTSMFTGLYQPNHGIIHQLPYTKPEEIDKVKTVKFWLPEFLQQNGYKTFAIDWIKNWFTRGFDFYGENPNATGPFDSAKEIVDLAISGLDACEKPFFILAHCWDTHFPFPNIAYVSSSDESAMEKTLADIFNQSQREYLRKRIQGKGLYTLKDMVDKYDLTIHTLDKEIGRFVNYLKEKRLWGNTVLMIMGDHGTNNGEHGVYFSHAGLFEDAIKIPFLIHLPGIQPKRVAGFAQHVDLVPTILDFIGLDAPEKFDGVSLLPLIKDNVQVRDKMLFFDGLCDDIRGIRSGNMKIVYAKNSFCNLCKGSHHTEFEAYDLSKDPSEDKNIISDMMKQNI